MVGGKTGRDEQWAVSAPLLLTITAAWLSAGPSNPLSRKPTAKVPSEELLLRRFANKINK